MDGLTIIVNGTPMLLKEYKKMAKAKKEASSPKSKACKKRKKTATSEIRLLSSDIKAMMRKVRLIKSLSAYYNNAYRQWGRIAREVLNRGEIRSPFISYMLKARELDNTMYDISEIAKRNGKAIFQYIEKLSYQLDDLRGCIDKLCSGIITSGVMEMYGTHECINGCGRRLGLRTLVSRSWGAVCELNDIISKCTDIAVKRNDAFVCTQAKFYKMLNS